MSEKNTFNLQPSQESVANAPRNIIPLADNLYRVQEGLYYTILLVTHEGVILGDPLNFDFATWLKQEIKKRFNVPVKFVFYSHDHWDHVSGGQVFADSATFISHQKAFEGIRMYNVQTALPQLTFEEQMTIHLGGEEVVLQYSGINHGMGNCWALFVRQKTLFAVDWLVLKRLPFLDLSEHDVNNEIDSLQRVLALPGYDIVSPGHSVIGTRDDVAGALEYLITLRQLVLDNINSNRSLEEARLLIKGKMKKYQDWGMYKEWIDMNINGMYYQMCNAAAKCRHHTM